MFCRARRPDESWRGGKRKEPKSSRKGNIETLKIGTESRGNLSLCSGMELHHPIMSKLWDLGVQTKRKKENDTLVTTLVADEILVITGIPQQDRLLPPARKYFVIHATNHWRKTQTSEKTGKKTLSNSQLY